MSQSTQLLHLPPVPPLLLPRIFSSGRHASGAGRSALRGMVPGAAVPTSNYCASLPGVEHGEEEQEEEEQKEEGNAERLDTPQGLNEQLMTDTQAEQVSTPTSTLEPASQRAPGSTHPQPQPGDIWISPSVAAARAEEAARGYVSLREEQQASSCTSHSSSWRLHPPRFSKSWGSRDGRFPSPGSGAEGSPSGQLSFQQRVQASRQRQAEACDRFEQMKSRVDELWRQADEARALAAAARVSAVQ